MKFRCPCGQSIGDSTDYIPYKARFIADQDFFDLLDQIEAHVRRGLLRLHGAPEAAREATATEVGRAAADLVWRYAGRRLYQCTNCGRLHVHDRSFSGHPFSPDSGMAPKDLLRSLEGDDWPRPLRGLWNSRPLQGFQPGELWWGHGVSDEGFERFDDWGRLEARYREVFERLHAAGILRDAFLRRDDEMIHQWSPQDRSSAEADAADPRP